MTISTGLWLAAGRMSSNLLHWQLMYWCSFGKALIDQTDYGCQAAASDSYPLCIFTQLSGLTRSLCSSLVKTYTGYSADLGNSLYRTSVVNLLIAKWIYQLQNFRKIDNMLNVLGIFWPKVTGSVEYVAWFEMKWCVVQLVCIFEKYIETMSMYISCNNMAFNMAHLQ